MAKSDNGELNNSNLASNNSDPNNSLLQKVTKRVSGLFPSSISKWFGPSDGSPSVIRRRETEDDDEQLQIQQPPKKRAKSTATDVVYSTSSNHFQMTSTPLLNSRHLQPGPSGYTRHTMLYDAAGDGPSTSRTQQLLNGDDKSERSDKSEKSEKSESGESTSGYSSVLVQQNKERGFVSDRGIHQPSTSKDTGTPSPNKSQSLNSSRSLFSEQSLTNPQRQCLSARRPSFNSSTFGSPTFVDRTLSTKRAVNSPFYGGRTIYGGASAYKRNRIIFPRDEANNLQVKNSVSIKPVNSDSTNENVSLSKTARRILDTLEHFSTPVLDAKKIPNINRQTINKRLTPYARENAPKAPNRELIIPTVPDLLKMKQKERLQNSTEQVRKLATTSKSVLNSEYSIRTLDDDESTKPQKHTSKIKAKIATVREKKNQLHDTIDAVKLPEIKLPITSLPKFDFTLPPPTPVVTQKPTENSGIKATAKTVDRYKFAKPIVVNCEAPAVKSINRFKFREPIDAKTVTNTTKVKENTLTFKADCSTAPRKKEQKNNGQNGAGDVGFALKPPEKLSEGSVMDILGKSDSLMDKFKPVVGTWECLACMVRNIPTATRCVACETLKEPIKKPETKPPVNNFGNQFKMTAEKWECGACMVRNNISETKCVACTTPKPGSTPAPVAKTPASNIFSNFGDKFKPASDTWECGACMIRNKNDAVKCVACETPKAGVAKDTKPSLIMRIPDAPPSSGFTDLIKKQQTNWECPSCMVRNPPEKKTCACCEGPKPGEKQEFKFGAGTTQFKFGIDKSAPITQTTSGSGFNFGANTAATPATTFSFGVKPTSVNTVDSKPTGFTFGTPATVQKTESQVSAVITTPSVTTESVNPIVTTSTTPSFSFGLPIQTTTSSSVVLNGDPTKKMFSFGTQSTTITSSTNSTAKATNIFKPVTSPSSTTTVTKTTIAAISTISTPSVSNSTVSSTSITTATTTGAASSTSFSFSATPKQPSQTPQFNFGSGSLPFNPVFGSASNIAPKTTTSTFVQPTTNFLTTTTTPQTQSNQHQQQQQQQQQNQTGFNASTFTFKSTSTNNNKTEVKPFSFASTDKTEAPKGGGKFPEFSFNPSTATATATATTTGQLTKVPVMNFAANTTEKPTPNSLFSFGAAKTEPKPPSFGGGGMFGQSVQTTPQNGGFNFGATAVTPNFNFGGGSGIGAGATATASSSTPTVFGFGTSQAGSGSATAAAASAPGLFTFGGGAPAQQPTAAAFTPDIKPNFNFSGGTPIGSFSAQGGPSATMPQRKIRKAVRRTQPR